MCMYVYMHMYMYWGNGLDIDQRSTHIYPKPRGKE
jgi:hypothetical protein